MFKNHIRLIILLALVVLITSCASPTTETSVPIVDTDRLTTANTPIKIPLLTTPSPTETIIPTWQPERNLSVSAASITTSVPFGTPIAWDGQFSPGEWDAALRQEFTDGGELFLMHDNRYLYLGVHENFDGLTVTSVFIENGNKVSVLHSSGSLGTAMFELTDNNWLLIQPFSWELYGVTSHTSPAENQRQAFLEKYGWLANLGSMTETEQIEYKILIPDGNFHIAVAYLLQPNFDQAAWWPAGLSDDCLNIKLLQGDVAENLNTSMLVQFAPDTWATVNVP